MLFDSYGNGTTQDEISPSTTSAIIEAAMLDHLNREELSMFLENQTEVDAALEEGVLLERTIVKLDKEAKTNRAYKAALFRIAKEKNDPKFKKLITIWKTERALEDYLDKKYGAQAMREAKQTMRNAQKSKSSMVAKAASRAKESLNGDKVRK